MNFKKQIQQKISAILLTMALLLPIAVQFVHALDEHKHNTCKEVATHLHEKKLDCSICDFHFSTFNFEVITLPELFLSEAFSKHQIAYFSSEKSTVHHHYYLRGPPLFS
jgi:hypothetical protein